MIVVVFRVVVDNRDLLANHSNQLNLAVLGDSEDVVVVVVGGVVKVDQKAVVSVSVVSSSRLIGPTYEQQKIAVRL